ncbi:MAG TPA: hypothetical protein VLL98_05480, partial [Rickettsiales bacterium]|nr:hypothetical protein [Rickettsiales bacterium]
HNDSDEQFGITLTSLVSLASKAYEIFESSKIEEKRQLINFMFSNLRLNGTELRFSLKQPFNLMVNLSSCQNWCTIIDIIRTKYFIEVKKMSEELKLLKIV